MKTSLAKLDAARAHRPPGYIEALLVAGHIEGEHLHIARIDLEAIRARFEIPNLTEANKGNKHRNHPSSLPLFASVKIRGLGDAVHAVAHPIARVIDRVAGSDLAHCGGCAQRGERLNAAIPFSFAGKLELPANKAL